MSDLVAIEIDLNAVRDGRVVTYAPSLGFAASLLRVGDLVEVVEEEGDSYLATIEVIDGARLELAIDLETLVPAVRIDWQSVFSDIEDTPYSAYMVNDVLAPQQTSSLSLRVTAA